MNRPVVFIDQTVDHGVQQCISVEKLGLMLQTLQTWPVDLIDIGVTEYKKYQRHLGEAEKIFFRGKIAPRFCELEAAQALGFEEIAIVYSHDSDCQFSELCNVLARACALNMKIALTVMNASRLAAPELDIFRPLVERFGIKHFVYGDRDSCLDPFMTYQVLADLGNRLSCTLEFHAHNTLGLATANTLSALRAGVRRVATAAAGVGADGHAPLEEVLMAGKHILHLDVKPPQNLSAACAQVLSCLELNVPGTKAIVGSRIFDHESGIHVDGVTKNPEMYEAFPPEEVGLRRRLVIGKHSGTASLQAKFREWNIDLGEKKAQHLLKKVRQVAVLQKSPLADDQLKSLYGKKRGSGISCRR